MLLNTKSRTAFVNAVLLDIKTDLDDDLIRKLVTEEAVACLPPAVRALYDNESTRGWVAAGIVSFASHPRSAPKPAGYDYWNRWEVRGMTAQVPGRIGPLFYVPSAKLKMRVLKMQQELEAKLDAKDAMKIRLTAMASTCKTREALVALLPHLEKYMPEPPPKAMVYAVPAVQVKDMMKELKKLGVPAPKVAEEAVAA